MSPPAESPALRMSQTQKDLVAGSIGGIAQVLVGQVRALPAPSCHSPSGVRVAAD